jgi:hypothetical protein
VLLALLIGRDFSDTDWLVFIGGGALLIWIYAKG